MQEKQKILYRNKGSGFKLLLVLLTLLMSGYAQETPSQLGLENDRFSELRIQYVRIAKGKFAPSYADYKTKTVHVWEGVVLTTEQMEVPLNIEPYQPKPHDSRHSLINLVKEDDWNIEYISVPVYCIKTKEGWMFGYYDKSTKILYGWKGLRYEGKEILRKYHKHKVSEPRDKVKIIDIEIPESFWDSLFSRHSTSLEQY